MRKLLIFFFCTAVSPVAFAKTDITDHTMWYDSPAHIWLEALPLGNSHMGAMVYGGTETEELQLNDVARYAPAALKQNLFGNSLRAIQS